MKDRFKFRVWEKVNKQMHYNDFVVTATGYIAALKSLLHPDNTPYEDEFVFNQREMDFDKDNVLMQCTGLKDKNGKPIYEGDIVKIQILEDFEAFGTNEKYIDIKSSIIYENSGFFIEQSDNNIFLGQIPQSELEVIGNIYENPELLEVKNV